MRWAFPHLFDRFGLDHLKTCSVHIEEGAVGAHRFDAFGLCVDEHAQALFRLFSLAHLARQMLIKFEQLSGRRNFQGSGYQRPDQNRGAEGDRRSDDLDGTVRPVGGVPDRPGSHEVRTGACQDE